MEWEGGESSVQDPEVSLTWKEASDIQVSDVDKPRRRLVDNTEFDVRDIGLEGTWIERARDRNRWNGE